MPRGGARPGAGRPSLKETGRAPAEPAGKKLAVYLPNALYAKLEAMAEKEGVRPSVMLRQLVEKA